MCAPCLKPRDGSGDTPPIRTLPASASAPASRSVITTATGEPRACQKEHWHATRTITKAAATSTRFINLRFASRMNMQHAKTIPPANSGDSAPPATPSTPVALPLSHAVEMRVRFRNVSLEGLTSGQIVWAIQMHMENWAWGFVFKNPGAKSPTRLTPDRFLRRDMLEPVDSSDARFLVEEEDRLRTKRGNLNRLTPPTSASAVSTA